MPFISVRILEGATPEQKSEVIAGITDVMVKVLGKNPETTHIVIEDVPAENWGHKGKSVADARKQSGS
ncbi:4-oxalocrotonate tautomerase [Devosia sp. YR412]|uniref:tautomerase family protein n=1 Tax=Devosia sp. YR412 TaxID=1881030 RepID=UPI0008D61411|nr:4-oxalocrotonate tautomerase family protein [Devosia sp. YR412]SEP72041.1 4-oxalocrotonate tautomerase [Devosia sp. YR412]